MRLYLLPVMSFRLFGGGGGVGGSASKMIQVIIIAFFDPFYANGLFLYSREISENLWFSHEFRGYRKRPMT